MNTWKLFVKASRFQVLPVMLIPVLLGTAGAFTWNQVFHPFIFTITLIGAAAAHLFSNMINDLWDFRNGVDTASKDASDAIGTHSGFLTKGTMTERKFSAWTWGLFLIALFCGLFLAVTCGWMVLVFAGLGGLLAYYYVAPPLRFGYQGKGYSEVAILLSFGVLPVLGGYFVQTSQIDYRAFLVSLPIGLLTTLILFNHHFLHWRADKLSGKNTLVVILGERQSIRFSVCLLFLSLAALIAAVLFGALPYYAIIALLTALPVIKAYRALDHENAPQAYLPLMYQSFLITLRCGFIMILSLVIQGSLN